MVVPKTTVCASALCSVPPATQVKQADLSVSFLNQHELSAADVRDSFGVVEIRTLRAVAGRQGHRVDQLSGLGHLHNRRAAVTDDK